ncbi:hypothetical protein Misp06_04473 [Microbulbifer sp. NBRC 101763]|uniref:hypothetical protein n=1 Tax=Microbulbifer sp. NBRC 101763 TaxID=1113820 RepID=UPI00309B5985
MNSKIKKNVLAIVGFVGLLLCGGALINMPVELPTEHRGEFSVVGKIDSCDFKGLTRHSPKFFVGIALQDSEEIYRVNPLHKERKFYESICSSKSYVHIKFRAIKRLVGPIRFWVTHIKAT